METDDRLCSRCSDDRILRLNPGAAAGEVATCDVYSLTWRVTQWLGQAPVRGVRAVTPSVTPDDR